MDNHQRELVEQVWQEFNTSHQMDFEIVLPQNRDGQDPLDYGKAYCSPIVDALNNKDNKYFWRISRCRMSNEVNGLSIVVTLTVTIKEEYYQMCIETGSNYIVDRACGLCQNLTRMGIMCNSFSFYLNSRLDDKIYDQVLEKVNHDLQGMMTIKIRDKICSVHLTKQLLT